MLSGLHTIRPIDQLPGWDSNPRPSDYVPPWLSPPASAVCGLDSPFTLTRSARVPAVESLHLPAIRCGLGSGLGRRVTGRPFPDFDGIHAGDFAPGVPVTVRCSDQLSYPGRAKTQRKPSREGGPSQPNSSRGADRYAPGMTMENARVPASHRALRREVECLTVGPRAPTGT